MAGKLTALMVGALVVVAVVFAGAGRAASLATIQDAPPPTVADGPVQARLARAVYAPAATLALTIANDGPETVISGGYRCGDVRVERWAEGVWLPVPLPVMLCPMQVISVAPGHCRHEQLPAPAELGWYRLAVSVLPPFAEAPLVIYSSTFVVQQDAAPTAPDPPTCPDNNATP